MGRGVEGAEWAWGGGEGVEWGSLFHYLVQRATSAASVRESQVSATVHGQVCHQSCASWFRCHQTAVVAVVTCKMYVLDGRGRRLRWGWRPISGRKGLTACCMPRLTSGTGRCAAASV